MEHRCQCQSCRDKRHYLEAAEAYRKKAEALECVKEAARRIYVDALMAAPLKTEG